MPMRPAIVGLSDAYRSVLADVLCAIGPSAAYAWMRGLARSLYGLAAPIRQRCEAQCRAVFGASFTPEAIRDLAAQAFIHRSLNLADLMLARRFIRPDTYDRRGGRIPDPYRSLLLHAQHHRRPLILLTCYYGPYDLLPLLLGYNGIRAAAIYRPHPNPRYDTFRNAVRSASGCELVPVHRALSRLPEVLETGGTAAILADHDSATGRGVHTTFLGQPALIPRTVGLLAAQYQAIVAVAAIRRRPRSALRFDFVVTDYFGPQTWEHEPDSVTWITLRYVAALEKLIRSDPAQYLWTRSREVKNPER